MPQQLHHLPAREVVEDLFLKLGAAALEPADLAVERLGGARSRPRRRVAFQLGQLLLQLEQRLFEVERVGGLRPFHFRPPSYHCRARSQRLAASRGQIPPASFPNQVRWRLAYRRVRAFTFSSAVSKSPVSIASAISP